MNIDRNFSFTVSLIWAMVACTSTHEYSDSNRSKIASKYPRMIGDIAPDSLTDNLDFRICGRENRIVQYYGLGEKTYKGEKWAIEHRFIEKYQAPNLSGQTGLIRIRFIVNCEGESGRFRLIGMDSDYKAKSFDPKITDQLMDITKSLDGWKTFNRKSGTPLEYYQYLIFKIKDGQLKEILP
ncbi:MAG: hypothetical protein AAGF85_19765 [Bacteroidota bacterium]